MTEQHRIDKLVEDFPSLFYVRPRCGIDYGEGWDGLIRKLCTKIVAIAPQVGYVTVTQIKEKFGTLRFYIDPVNVDKENWELIGQAISEAEQESAITCEYCGKPGVARSGSWIRTLCDEHGKERPEWVNPWKVAHDAWKKENG